MPIDAPAPPKSESENGNQSPVCLTNARYQKALKSVNPSATPGFVSLEGYVAGRLVVEALKRSEDPITRAGLLATIKTPASLSWMA